MKSTMTAIAAISLALGTAACGDSGDVETQEAASDGTISGDWIADIDSVQFENDNRDYVLADGTFDCRSCIPPYQTPADGEWHEVDRPGVDGVKIEVVDENTVISATRLGENELGTTVWKVSEDGQTLTGDFTDESGDETVTGSEAYTRTGDGPEGAHAMSGQWTNASQIEIDDAGLRFSFAVDGDQFTSTSNDSRYTATLGGEPVAIEGNNAGTMVAVEETGENAYRQTYTRDGEVVGITEISVDGDTLSATNSDPRDGSSVSYTAQRQ